MIFIELTLVVSVFLIIYHLAIHPMILLAIKVNNAEPVIQQLSKPYIDQGEEYPEIDVIMPVYNEADILQEKLWNLFCLDYPKNKLHIHIALDGCKDNSLEVIEDTLGAEEFNHLDISCHDFQENRGKVAVINNMLEKSKSPLVVLTDTSALLPVTSLKRMADWFSDQNVGAVTSSYRLLQAGQDGESVYWQYQTRVKAAESNLGSVIGAHGACYAMRRSLYQPLPKTTINDDFVLPMSVIRQGFRVVYDINLASIETEGSSTTQDFSRRQRLSAGNLQQLFDCRDLLHPKYGWVAYNFFAGKCLRAFLPVLLLIIFLCNIALASLHPFYLIIFYVQFVTYALTTYYLVRRKEPTNKLIFLVFYLCSGFIASLIGSFKFMFGYYNQAWKKV